MMGSKPNSTQLQHGNGPQALLPFKLTFAPSVGVAHAQSNDISTKSNRGMTSYATLVSEFFARFTMSTPYYLESALTVHHWTPSYFSFTTTRAPDFRFENGQFVMIGLPAEDGQRPILRAYSIASANWEEHLEFFSIKIANGALTSRLQHIKPSQTVLIGKKPTGTLLLSDLRPGRRLYLLATGTGLAPWLAIIKDPETYERFDQVILTHGVRYREDLAYRSIIEQTLPQHPYLGEMIRRQLRYYPVVSREDFINRGRLTSLLAEGTMEKSLHLPPIDPASDRFMICGSSNMLAELRQLLDQRGFQASTRIGQAGDYVFERAFVEK